MQGLGSTLVVTHDGQRDGPFRGFAFAGGSQEQSGLRLLIPVNDHNVEGLIGNFVTGRDSV